MSDHDPLCPQQPRDDGTTLTMLDGKPIYCLCDLIAKVREDELAKCIEVIDDMVIDTVGNSAATVDQVLDALRGLQEKP